MNLLIKNLKSTILLVLDRYRSKIGIWLLGMVLLGIGQQAEAADWNLTKKSNYVVTDHPQDGYVTFKIIFYDDDGDNEYVKPGDGHLYVNGTEIMTYGSPTTGVDVPVARANVTLHKGYFEFKSKDGTETAEGGDHWYEFNRDGKYITYMTFDWYYPKDYEGVDMKFKVDVDITVNNQKDQEFNDEIGSAKGRSFNNPTLTPPQLSSNNPGKYELSYSIPNNPINIWNSEDSKTISSTNTSGTLLADIDDTSREYDFQVQYKLNKKYNSKWYSTKQTIPAFQQAIGFDAMDVEGGNTKLTWKINNKDKNCQVGDKFEIQRANNPDFNPSTLVGSIDFSINREVYEMLDESGNQNANGKQYYRIRRNKQQSWGWNISEEDTITKNISHRKVVSATAERFDWPNGQNKARITWKLNELKNKKDSLNAVWSKDSKIMIKRTMNNGMGSITHTLLTAGDTTKTEYIDELNTMCTEYSYAVYVQPGNSNFEIQSEIPAQLSGEPIVPTVLGQIETLTASKGYYPGYTQLNWTTDGKAVDKFYIFRRIYKQGQDKDANWENIDMKEGGATKNYVHTDEKGHPGYIYEYRVAAVTICAGKEVSNNSPIDRGFRSPTGIVSGKITFAYGDAAPGVVVRLTGTDIQAGHSLQFDGSSTVQTKEEMEQPENFTVQVFVRPESAGQNATIVNSSVYRLSLQDGKPAFSANNGTTWVTAPEALKVGSFTSLTAVYSTTGSWTLYIDTIQKVSQNPATRPAPTPSIVTLGKGFKGHIDEVRLWDKTMELDEIKSTYDRVLNGNETGLKAYWRFDEGVTDECYDISYTASTYNANHCTISNAIVSDVVPNSNQLGLKSVTGTDGVFTVTGIPYEGNGSTYTLTPSYPNHTFNPSSKTVTIGSTTSSISGQDFTDNSAIKIDGYVFYENSTIPVQNAMFKINGELATSGDGSLIRSNDKGKFEFSVPIGRQRVEVVKDNHVFKNDGVLINENSEAGEYINFEQPMSDLRFWDQTKVKLLGRVAGGTVERDKPLGFSLSKNNLGDNICLKLTLEEYPSAEMNTNPEDSLMVHYNSKHSNNVEYQKQQILIHADKKTGEFIAWLYPEKYKVEEVHVDGWDNLINGKNETLTLDNCFEGEISEYTDEEGTTHRYAYNSEFNYNHRVNPSLTYVQLAYTGGEPLEYFGDATFMTTTMDGDNQEVTLYDKESKSYLFGKPVFHKASYIFRVSSHEDYYYNKKSIGDNIVVDQVPTQGGDLKITNEMNQETAGSATLDDTGVAEVKIEVNSPDISGANGGLKKLDFAVGSTTAEQLVAYVLGSRSRGSSFVSAGPIRLMNILRDPPGSHSYSYCEKGQTYTYHSSYATGKAHKGSERVNSYFGGEFETGVGFITKNEAINTVGIVAEQEASSSNANGETFSVTTTNRYQTSDDPLYVGADGDLFLGTTSNIVYGPADNITVMTKTEYKRLEEAGSDSGIYGEEHQILATAGDFVLAKRIALSLGLYHDTFFAYPQIYIKNTLLNNIRALRNSMFAPFGTTESQAKAMANAQNQPVYITYRKADEKGYGEDNKINKNENNVELDEGGYASNGDSYMVVWPDGAYSGTSDTIYVLNQSIRQWENLLAQNEREKAEATDLVKNYSFHAGGMLEEAEQLSHVTEHTYTYNLIAGGGATGDIGFRVAGVGLIASIEELGYSTKDTEESSSSEESRTAGFVLADEGDDDYLSVDVFRVKAPEENDDFNNKWNGDLGEYVKGKQYGSFVFRTTAGATSCPYEGELRTEYYNPGTLLNTATLKIENPKISAEKPVVSNVPSDQAAKFVLNLYNESEAAEGCYFNLSIVDAANQKGAKFSIDGVPLADKRGILVNYGEVLQKTLEIRRGTEYDYEDLAIVLSSQCQADPTGFQEIIADTVYISAHFIPSSSDINIKSPTDKWTLNTNSSKDSTGKYYMPLTINGFDVNFQGFHHIEVQYKASSEADTRWTNICSFFTDTAYYKEASGTKAFIEGPTITTRFFGAEDQNYDIRAVTFSKVGNEFVTKESPVITGVKDTKRPVVFGNIEPADGVLGVEDEIRLTFNETIAEGYMTEVKNFRVTGTRNGSNGDHSTALTFDGRNSYLETQVTRNLEAKDVTVKMWINPSASGQDMTLFSHGDATNALELTLAKDNTLKVRIGELEYSSRGLNVKLDEWQHIAMTYQAANQQLSVYFSGQEVVTGVQTVPYSGIGPMRFGRSLKGGNYFAGQMHEARVWTKVVEMTDLIANSLRIYTGREAGLLAYYRMNEGKGDMAMDKSQGATAYMYGATWSTQDGKSLSFNGKDAIAVVNSSRVAITGSSDYTLEFWFKAAADQKEDAALVANGKGVGEESNGNTNKVFVGFVDNELLFRNNGYEQKVAGNFRDGAWHHFVLAVNRTAGNAQIFMDGVLNSYFDASNVGGFSATQLYAGARRWTEAEQMVNHTDMHLDGAIDELRIWNMALPASTVSNNYNISPEGTEMGLMMYLPFSKYITNSANIQELVYSGDDLVTDSTLVTLEKAVATSEVPPVCKKAPETSIPFTFVVNKDALVINLMDTPEAIEKTTVNFTVKDVSDLNGNLMESPVTWSAYIDRNQLKWSEKSVTKEKKLNATMTFAVDVENHGGTVKNFTIEGLPAWLDAMPESGSIDPQGRETILFTVDEGTNVGRYDEVIYVKGDNNVAESLPVTLKVFDEQPDWTVNPGDFAYNMNVYGRIRFNKLFSADAEDMLAAFDAGGRCIGVANSQYLKDNDMWYVFLTVYSNTNRLAANQIEFRSWDASTGLVYTAYPSEEISFESDKVWGTASAPIIFDGEERVVQNIDLIKGWNWISYNVASELFSDPASVLSKAIFAGDEQVKDETNGIYMTYDGVRKQWVNNDPAQALKFDNRHMFLLQSPMVQKLSVSGLAIHEKENLKLDILPNWNYISYLSTVNLPISEALAGFEAVEGDIIKSQDRFSMYGETTGWLGSLTYLEPGKGYMLFSKNKTTLTYPDVTAGTTTRSTISTRSAGMPVETMAEQAGQYAANMSVVATVADNMPLYSGDRLLAYANGELRAEAMVTERPSDGESLFFLSVGGDRNEGISFALERGGEIIAETSPMLDYAANTVRGDIEQPMIIDFINDLEISVYPNPFEHELNFMLNAKSGDKVEIMLYTMAGQMFHRYQTTAAADGYIHHRYHAAADMSKGIYMATVIINGERHVYKISKR